MIQQKKTQLCLICFLLYITVLSNVTNSELETRQSNHSGKHFVLIHGSCHGAWSWYKIVTLLKSLGHKVTAVDCAASGIDPQQAMELQSVADYFRPLTDFMASLRSNERVILVGHSLGGMAVSHAMENFPEKIALAVFVTALMPGPTLNITTLNIESFSRQGPLLDSSYTYDDGPSKPPTTFVFGPLYLSSYVYQLSPPKDWTLATMLMRPLRIFSEGDLAKVLILSESRYGSVKRAFVVSDNDQVSNKDFQLWMIQKNPPNHVLEIRGSDHMVMMSKPWQLSLHLHEISCQYA